MKAVFIAKAKILQTLKTKATKGKRLLEPFKSFAEKSNLPFKILEDKKVSNEPEIHVKEGDLWKCLEGEVDFVCDGSTFHLKSGDWLWIPPGVVHQHSTSSMARLIIIKIQLVSNRKVNFSPKSGIATTAALIGLIYTIEEAVKEDEYLIPH